MAVGGFDENFSAYGFEDMEVAFRLEDQAGISFQVLPSPVPLHVHHHTPEQYFAKKVECGRYSLPHLARLHPGRIREMHLHHAVDIPGQLAVSGFTTLIRFLAASSLGRDLPRLLSGWPTLPGQRPLLSPLYYRLMNLAVLCSYRQGVTETKS